MTGSFTDRQARYAFDKLYARTLVLDDGATKIALCILDSCHAPREIYDAAKRKAAAATGIPVERMLMAATHTHTAPTVSSGVFTRADAEYVAFLKERLAESVIQADKRRVPAQIGWGVAECPDEVFCRRWLVKPGTVLTDPFGKTTDKVKMNPGHALPMLDKPSGPVDSQIVFLSVKDLNGRPTALFANYGLHYVGDVPADALSADYFGEFAVQIRKELVEDDPSADFVGMLSNGTSGNVNNIDYSKPAPPAGPPMSRIKAVASKVARLAAAAEKKVRYSRWESIAMTQVELPLATRRPTAEQMKEAEAVLAKPIDQRGGVLPDYYARAVTGMKDFPAERKMPLQAIRVGGLAIVTSACETFADTGLEIKAKSPFKPTFVVELANDEMGYLPTPEQHLLGGYETWLCKWSSLEPEASSKIRDKLLEMLGGLN
ncbi:MAG: hypothetical protein ACRDD1_22725, partial [Planctomycetia bacterium]